MLLIKSGIRKTIQASKNIKLPMSDQTSLDTIEEIIKKAEQTTKRTQPVK